MTVAAVSLDDPVTAERDMDRAFAALLRYRRPIYLEIPRDMVHTPLAGPTGLGGGEDTKKHAASLCRTLQEKILKLPDYVEVYPTHVSGSLCGGSIGSRLSTTVGYERRMNKLLAALSSATLWTISVIAPVPPRTSTC